MEASADASVCRCPAHQSSTRTGLIAGLAGLAALGSLAITARTYRLTEQATSPTATPGHRAARSANLDVRLGGIYALERIAVDSRRDHPTVVEVLSAFTRERSNPAHTNSEPTIAEVLSNFLRGDGEPADKLQPDGGGDKEPKPAEDIQAAVTVLGRLPKRPGVSRGDLAGAQLGEADLSGAQLGGGNLPHTYLLRVDLSGAYLWGAQLGGADPRQARGVTQAQLDAARGDVRTQLPAGLRRSASRAAAPPALQAPPP